ncbi:hypothetical protein [Breznakia pachnodae]|uniref:DUF5626 domain-containing protein n=1 Tax=Breznakia pachnodae TaxID=265178 RepID=A0ABU0DXS5_9FIRM|nr:hypothetical protein [Breznakia pachnodae]MDQ0359439.1 hypothetical protein [Breznakia pachnodae]
MKKIKLLLAILLCTLVVVPTAISAEENTSNDDNNSQQVQQDDDYEFVELSREEFIKEIADLNNISYEEAEIKVNVNNLEGFNDAIVRGEKMPRALETRYGYFTSRFYTPTDTDRRPEISTNAYYGVYASYYLPTGSTSWSLRKFLAIHDVFIYAGNSYTAVKVQSKNANITSAYNIKFSALIQMKRDQLLHVYINYTVTRNFGL